MDVMSTISHFSVMSTLFCNVLVLQLYPYQSQAGWALLLSNNLLSQTLQWNLQIIGTLGTHHFVLCREVVLFQRLFCIVYIQWYYWFVLCREVCPLSEVILYSGLSFVERFVLFQRLFYIVYIQWFVLCREVVLFQRLFCIVYIQWCYWFVLCWEVCPLSECPLLEVSLYSKTHHLWVEGVRMTTPYIMGNLITPTSQNVYL